MARVGGINIPDNKHVDVSLTHVYGIGRKTAQDICDKLIANILCCFSSNTIYMSE